MEACFWDHAPPYHTANCGIELDNIRVQDGRAIQSTRRTPGYVILPSPLCIRSLTSVAADSSFSFGVISAVVSGAAAAMLTFTGLAARRGKSWAAGRSARKARRHRRTRSGRVVPVLDDNVEIPPDQRVKIGEVEAVLGQEAAADERTALLEGNSGEAAGGSEQRATDDAV